MNPITNALSGLCFLAFGATAHAASTVTWGGNASGPEWTGFVTEAIKSQGDRLSGAAPEDMKRYCPNYATLSIAQKRDVWAKMFALLAFYESGYDPEKKFTESFDDSAGNPVVSRGLLQLSIESANGYGCGIGRAAELHDPKTNLACAARIAARWAVRDGVVARKNSQGNWRGLARYWSPFRNTTKRTAIMNKLKVTKACR